MPRLKSMTLAGTLAAALAAHMPAHGQNTPASPTPQTGNAAPAATGSAAIGAQAAEAGAARNSATHGSAGAAQSRAQGGSRRSAGAPGGASSQGGTASQNGAPAGTGTQGGRQAQPAGNNPSGGITGVPRYRAGFRGQRGTTAPAATASVTVTGDNDGSAASGSVGTGSVGTKGEQSAALPGVPVLHNAFGIAKGTPIHVRLQQPVDSGHAKNGDTVHGMLTAPVGGAPTGAPVQLTVVAVAAAGQMSSNGELSLQVVSVNGERVLSDVITAEGKEGAKIMPDDAPGQGTEAIFTPDQPLTLPAG